MSAINQIIQTIQSALPDAEVQITNPQKDGLHFDAVVISLSFEGKSLLEQHKMVMNPLQTLFTSKLHALSLKTYTPKQWGEMIKMNNMQEKIKQDIEKHSVILFMKGSKLMPLCSFSSRVVDILNKYRVKYETRDVLNDDSLRQKIKEFSSWPTLPQLYIQGKFIGGCDIVLQLHNNGQLETMLNQL